MTRTTMTPGTSEASATTATPSGPQPRPWQAGQQLEHASRAVDQSSGIQDFDRARWASDLLLAQPRAR